MKHFLFFLGLAILFALPKQATGQWDTLRIVFAGDIMGHSPQIKSAEVVPDKQYDYSPCFRYVRPILEKADLAIGNLELTLPGKPPYTGYPMFRSPNAIAVALKEAGFDILATANNHSNDSRGTGLTATVQTLRNMGFIQTGTFKTQSERNAFYPLMIYKDGFKIALLNYTYGTNGVPTDAPTIVNLIDKAQIQKDLAEAVARKPDFIITFMHWGLEYQLQENAEQRDLAQFVLSNGSDMVIGSHPHVVQPIKWETVTTTDGKEKKGLVVYSLGNYISNQQKPGTDGGIMFQFDIVKNKGVSKATLGKYGFMPVYRYVHKNASGQSTFYTLPVAMLEKSPDLFPNIAAASRTAMKSYAEGVRKRLADCPEWK
ncbi:MAG: CapA family protein [Lewinellaceae bacterium]|nr:CapA family protein [Lewinellaceae bacterium]